VNLQELLETPRQIRRLASDMVTTAVLFQGEPESGAELIHACLPGLLSYVVKSAGNLADAAACLEHSPRLVRALESADWPIDQNVLNMLRRAETALILRRWSAILSTMVKHPVISEELERRTAEIGFNGWDEQDEDV